MKLILPNKAMRLDNGKWIYGFYVALEQGEYIEHLIYTGKCRGDSIDFPERLDVVPETVGFLIGEDLAGTGIYSGDIIASGNDDERVVEFGTEFNFNNYIVVGNKNN